VSVHEELRTLVNRYGNRVLDAADDLRATLDDFLEVGQATPGEINLLVDAVRLGAYQQLLSMLAHGADPRAAVEGAGARLAEDRGGEQRSASWACATLGYAVGRVPEAVVLSYLAQQPSRGSVAAPPPVPGQYGPNPAQTASGTGVPPPQPPHAGQPPAYAPSAASAPTQAPGYAPAAAPSGAGNPWEPPAPPASGAGSRRNVLIGAGAAVAALAVVGVVAAVVLGGGDEPQGADASTTTTPTQTVETFDPTFSPEELTESYSALGEKVGEGADSCERSEPEDGQSELVRCTYSQLEVLFATYVDESALEDARSGIEEEATAQTYEIDTAKEDDSGTWHRVSDPTLDETWMYWDSTDALQSAYVSDTTDDLPTRAADTFFDQRGAADATRVFPDPVAPFESAALWEMAQDYVGDQAGSRAVADCEPSKLYEGDLESISCTDGDYTMFFYLKDSIESLDAERETVGEGSVSDTTWNWFRGKAASYPTSGRLIKTVVDDQAVVYWDDTAQLLTGYIYGPTKKMKPVVNYWADGE
jgi:hypothetical protein